MDLRILIGHAVKVAILVTLIGLAWRARGRRCLAMLGYLWFALLGNVLTTFWPATFFHFDFWARRQVTFDALKLLIAAEVAMRSLRTFPGARASWRASVFGGLALAAALYLALPQESTASMLLPYQPQLVVLTVWLFTMTALVVVYYRIPVDPWHRAILLGFAPYQLVFTAAVGLGRTLHMPLFPWLSALDSIAYLALMCWWARAAWREEEALGRLARGPPCSSNGGRGMIIVVIGLAVLSTLAVLFVLGRFTRASAMRDWEMALGPRSEGHLAMFEETKALDGMMADDAWTGAVGALSDGDLRETVRLLELSYTVLEAATADRRTRLRGVAVCAHMAAGLAPVRPLMPRDFRLRQLATLAGAAQLVHHVLVGGRERLVAHARFISFGFRLSLRALSRARALELEEALRRFDDAKADWKTLDRAHVETVRSLILSLEAVRRERVFVAPL